MRRQIEFSGKGPIWWFGMGPMCFFDYLGCAVVSHSMGPQSIRRHGILRPKHRQDEVIRLDENVTEVANVHFCVFEDPPACLGESVPHTPILGP